MLVTWKLNFFCIDEMLLNAQGISMNFSDGIP